MFQMCSGQVIVAGMGDVLGIKFEAIQFLLDLYSIDDILERRLLFEKIKTIDIIRMDSSRNSRNVNNNKNKKRN